MTFRVLSTDAELKPYEIPTLVESYFCTLKKGITWAHGLSSLGKVRANVII